MELRKEEPKRDKALVLKTTNEDEFDDNDLDIVLFSNFKKFMKNSIN